MTKIKPLINIEQSNTKEVYIGKINYFDLEDKIRLIARSPIDKSSSGFYQREPDKKRIKDIKLFLESNQDNILPFPTPLVLALNTLDESFENEEDIKNYFSNADNPEAVLDNKLSTLYLPDIKEKIFIVDGQHRFLGTKEFLQDNKEIKKFEFNVTILINYDIYEQAKVFANINFKQKPVNRSLFFDIFGSVPDEKNELTFVHYLVVFINNYDGIDGIVKLLGKGPGVVSLAFMVETILKHWIDNGGKIFNLFTEYQEVSGENYKKLPSLFANYLLFYKTYFSDYFPEKNEKGYSSYYYKYYLFKATGMYGLIRLFNDLYEKNIININMNQDTLYDRMKIVFKNIINNPAIYFDNEEFKKSGSAGLQKKLYTLIKNDLLLD